MAFLPWVEDAEKNQTHYIHIMASCGNMEMFLAFEKEIHLTIPSYERAICASAFSGYIQFFTAAFDKGGARASNDSLIEAFQSAARGFTIKKTPYHISIIKDLLNRRITAPLEENTLGALIIEVSSGDDVDLVKELLPLGTLNKKDRALAVLTAVESGGNMQMIKTLLPSRSLIDKDDLDAIRKKASEKGNKTLSLYLDRRLSATFIRPFVTHNKPTPDDDR